MTWYHGGRSERFKTRDVFWLTGDRKYAESFGPVVSEVQIRNARTLDMRRETAPKNHTWIQRTVSEWAKILSRKRVRLNGEAVDDYAEEETAFEGLFVASSESVTGAGSLDAEGAVRRAGYDSVKYYEPTSGRRTLVLMVLNAQVIA